MPRLGTISRRPVLALAALAVWTIGVPRPASGAKIHLVIAADTLDPRVGKNVEVDMGKVGWAFEMNVPRETGVLSITQLSGRDCTPNAILAAIQRLPVQPDDAVVFFYHGHGAYDPQAGQYLTFPRLGSHLTRSALTAAVKGRGARLGVIATDCCNTLSMLKRIAPPTAPSAQAPMLPPNVSPLFRSLFLDAVGFVDLMSSKQDEQSISYPATRDQNGFESYGGGLFTTAITDLFEAWSFQVLTWDEVSRRTATAVREAFRRLKPDGLDNPDAPEAPQMTQTVVASIAVRAVRTTASNERVPLGLGAGFSPTPPIDSLPPSQYLGILGYENAGRGLLIWATKPGSPAARLGLERGDVILTVNDNPIRTARGFQQSLLRAPGVVNLTFQDIRTREVRSAAVDLANFGFRSPPYQVRPGDPTTFGASVEAAPGGVRVVAVAPGSPSAMLELDPGDLITTINGVPVADDPSYRAAIASSPDELWLELININTGQKQGFVATLDRRPTSNYGPVPLPTPDGANLTFGVHGFDNGGYGVMIWGTRPGSPAARLGLEQYDLILAVDGREVRGVDDYRAAIAGSGGQVMIRLRDCRTGQIREAQATLDRHPPPPIVPDGRSVFGAVGIGAAEGVVVQSVVPGSAANIVGVDPGDVILSVNGRPVRGTDDYIRAVRTSPDEMTFVVRNVRNGQLLGMVVQLDR